MLKILKFKFKKCSIIKNFYKKDQIGKFLIKIEKNSLVLKLYNTIQIKINYILMIKLIGKKNFKIVFLM